MKDPINQVTSDSLIKIKPEHVSVEIDGEILAMHIKTGRYLGFNEVASLSQAVQTEFAVDAATSADDTLAFVQRMLDDGLVEIVKE